MTCREFTEFLSAYLSGELSAAEAAEFERHLRECRACGNYLDTYKKTIEISRAAFNDEVNVTRPASESTVPGIPVPERLVQAILAARRKSDKL